ncbi:outer membrane protein assembly factor BamB family protein [Streptomyces sp. GSL17-111]|uniref:outer membrane protein assembly factor BamB family protein n=1 Tax=Streptomyces sp. GSL17-111 TaxID=3121596 RepID=UPI0030F3DAF2
MDDPERVGRYRVVRRIGAGGMGRVYLARSPSGRSVAVKVVRPELAEDPDFRRRFAREVAAARRVNGFFTAAVVDADPDGEPPWLATAYVPGPSLDTAVRRDGPLDAASVAALGAGLAEALHAVHAAGVVHRDLKPSNVLVTDDGPRVIDFGISVAADDTVLTRTGVLVGTPGFMAPEQLTGAPVGPACDVFALGAVLVFAATGRGPFGGGSSHGLGYRVVHEEPDLSGVPARIAGVVRRCLAKDPSDRPAVEAVLDELAPAPAPVDPREALRTPRTAESPAVPPSPTVPPAPTAPAVLPGTPPRRRLPARRRVRRGATAAALAALIAGVTVGERPPQGPAALWSFAADDSVYADLTWAGETLYVGSFDDHLHALDPATGKRRWSFPAGAGVISEPAFGGGAVYFADTSGEVHAVDAITGQERWRVKRGTWIDSSPAVVDGTLYIGSDDHRVYALDTATGATRWTFTTGDDVDTTPAVADGTVYVTSHDRRLYALDAETGEERWTAAPGDLGFASPLVAGGTVYVGGWETRRLYAFDAATGARRWAYTTGAVIHATPLLVDGTLYTGSDDGFLYALDAESGELRWRFEAGEQIHTTPALHRGVLYVGAHTNRLHAVDVETGRQLWSFDTGEAVIADPVVADGRVHVANADGEVFALPVETPKP